MSAPPPSKRWQPSPVFAVVVLGCVLACALAVVSTYAIHRRLTAAKTAEARNQLGHMGYCAMLSWQIDGKLCASASRPIPAEIGEVAAKRYPSTAQDWEVDKASNAGFYCLQRYRITEPQYYQYSYEQKLDGFALRARGDLDGDDQLSSFEIRGGVIPEPDRPFGRFHIDPAITETNPDE